MASALREGHYMRYEIKRQVQELCQTYAEAMDYLFFGEGERDIPDDFFLSCRDCLVNIADMVKGEVDEQGGAWLSKLCRTYDTALKAGAFQDEQWADLAKSAQALKEMVGQIRAALRVAFFPYKASMWSSFESVWEAFAGDPRFACKVVPIPYRDLNADGTLGESHYEGAELPSYVPITRHESYLIQRERPDFVFIHNPYDAANRVTRVDRQFFSSRLQQYTHGLCYVPYYSTPICNSTQYGLMFGMPAHINCWRYFVPSQSMAATGTALGYDPEKMVAAGSPKWDRVVKAQEKGVAVPEAWKRKARGRKVLLWDTHLSYFGRWGDNMAAEAEKTFSSFRALADELTVIWRPHPLTEASIRSMQPQYAKPYADVVAMAKEQENIIIDTSGDYLAAFLCSDAMLTWFGSLTYEYLATGKPVIIDGPPPAADDPWRNPLHLALYANNRQAASGLDRQTAKTMLAYLVDDPDKEKRLKVMRQYIQDDGLCGRRIYEYILAQLGLEPLAP